MQLENIDAKPHPYGNRIDLSWANPEPDVYRWVRIVRREGSYPVSYEDGQNVGEADAFLFTSDVAVATHLDDGVLSLDLIQNFSNAGIFLASDAAVKVEETSKKWLVTYEDNEYVLKKEGSTVFAYNRKGFAVDKGLKSEHVYYYCLFPFKKTPLEYVTDLSHRIAATATGPYDAAGQMYDLLPRIYQRYDTVTSNQTMESDQEKGELRRFFDIAGSQLDQLYSFAKTLLHVHNIDKIDGRLLPLLAQWIGWKTDYRNEIDEQRNEIREAPFIHKTTGVISNVEAAVKRISGWESRTKEFVHNVFVTNYPEQLNLWATEAVSDTWSEPEDPFSLDLAYEGRPSGAQEETGKTWLFYHTYRDRLFQRDGTFRRTSNIWYKTWDESGWSPSMPLTDRVGIDKYPTAAVHGENLIVFWSVYSEKNSAWHIEYKVHSDKGWRTSVTGYETPFGLTKAERKKPFVVTDDAGGLWLFWLEKKGHRWQMRYNRHDGHGWQLSTPADFPFEDEHMDDAFVLFCASGGAPRIYVFWSRKDDNGRSLSIAYTWKNTTDVTLEDWDATLHLVPKTAGQDYDDREPSALVTEAGTIDLFWSSTKEGSASIRRNALAPPANVWGVAEEITKGPFSERDPLPLMVNSVCTVVYRSNKGIPYKSQVYKATETTDFRYAGSVTVDTQNTAKNELHGEFEDFQAYTYDTGRKDDNWYARDTVAMYLKAGTGDPGLINRNRGIVKQLLTEIMPIQVRPVFVIETVEEEKVYTYDFKKDKVQRVIIEQFADSITTSGKAETYAGITDARVDAIPEWSRMYVLDVINNRYREHRTVNFDVPGPARPDTAYRTWHTGLNREIEEDTT
ncbi:MAG: hypothetical protein A4E58_01876 [Syntrophorhabdus sp. PtaB.Bin006]|nr:MAG: hypothetical protein A4E58_01876 [Syntrophorhabdus sp. PtaB.Bin006]